MAFKGTFSYHSLKEPPAALMKHLIPALLLFVTVGLLAPSTTRAQSGKLDSLFQGVDTTAVMDSLMKDFDSFLDSLHQRKSMFMIGMGVGTGFFSFENKNSVYLTTEKKLMYSPHMGYFHKSGLGVMVSGYAVNHNNKLNLYQVAISPTYDLIKRHYSAGISYTHYLTKDSVGFYTTPIRNELFAYFSYKNWWLRPGVSVSYGWGSRTDYEEQQYSIWLQRLQRSRSFYITVKNQESVQDLSVTFSVRKDFDWYDVFTSNDNFTITPVLLLNAGTQQFGFNTSYSYNATAIRANSLPSNSSISDQTNFGVTSASAVFRCSYMIGKFMLQPQVFADYYIPKTDVQRWNSVFSVSASLTF